MSQGDAQILQILLGGGGRYCQMLLKSQKKRLALKYKIFKMHNWPARPVHLEPRKCTRDMCHMMRQWCLIPVVARARFMNTTQTIKFAGECIVWLILKTIQVEYSETCSQHHFLPLLMESGTFFKLCVCSVNSAFHTLAKIPCFLVKGFFF